jgi:hypothetical protein
MSAVIQAMNPLHYFANFRFSQSVVTPVVFASTIVSIQGAAQVLAPDPRLDDVAAKRESVDNGRAQRRVRSILEVEVALDDDRSDGNEDDSRASRHLHPHGNRTRTVPGCVSALCLRIRSRLAPSERMTWLAL